MYYFRIYAVVHTIIWIPIVILLLLFGHGSPEVLAIILTGAFGPAVLILLDCAVIAYHSRRLHAFYRDEDLPDWLTRISTVIIFIWTVYRYGGSWKSMRILEGDLEIKARKATLSEALVDWAMAVCPDNVQQVRALVQRENFLAARLIVERADAKQKRRGERGQKRADSWIVSQAQDVVAKGRALGIESEVAALLGQSEGGNLEAAEALIAKTQREKESVEVLRQLEERIAKLPPISRPLLVQQLRPLATYEYQSREFRRALHNLDKNLVVAEEHALLQKRRKRN